MNRNRKLGTNEKTAKIKKYHIDGTLSKEVKTPLHEKHIQLHMPKEIATQKRKSRINNNGKKYYTQTLVMG